MKNFDAFKAHGDVIWNIANLLRGPYRPPQYRRVMIPLTVLRRLDCVLEATKDKVIAEHKRLKAEDADHRKLHGEDKYGAETIEKFVEGGFLLARHGEVELGVDVELVLLVELRVGNLALDVGDRKSVV